MMNKKNMKRIAGAAMVAAMLVSSTPAVPIVSYAATAKATVLTVKDSSEVTISEDGVYELSGSYKDTVINVEKGVTAELIFNKLTLTDKNASAENMVTIGKNAKVTITLKGSSKLIGSSSSETLESAIVHKKDGGEGSLTIRDGGNGSLTITGTKDDGIKYKEGTVTIESGTLKITDCHGDGIQAENVSITGGYVDITTVYDEADTSFYTSGNNVSGKNTITEQENTKVERVNVDTGSHKGIKVGTKAKTYSYKSVTSEDLEANKTYTQEGSGLLSITGGTVVINTAGTGLKANKLTTTGYTATSSGKYIVGSPDDALASNGDIVISGKAKVTVTSSDDGLSAAGTVTIKDTATVDIQKAYEGVEAEKIIIGEKNATSGPNVTIESNDDGMNASGKTVTYVYDDETESTYTKTSVSDGTNAINIYSGKVTIKIDSENAKTVKLNNSSLTYQSSGDGMDSNGDIDIEGGEVYVFGQSTGDNSPIDMDGNYTLSKNATVLAVGCNPMGEVTPKAGDSVYVTYGESGNMGQFPGMQTDGSMPTPPTDGSMPTPPSDGQFPTDGNMPTPPTDGQQPPEGQNPLGGTASIAAGSVVTVKSGDTTVYETTIPYAASYIFYASPMLSSDAENTITVSEKTTDDSQTTDTKTTETIKGKTTTIKTAKALGKQKIKVTWEKNSLADGYQIAYRKKGGSWKYVTVSNKTTVSKVLTGLKKGKTYEVKVRAYQKVNGKKVYAKYSKVRTLKCK
ncbi:MAG: carbohydrate-binding domain-containing protein [Lachnospiraceae bacterium]|nr:carbohydrate-binding domain-containing protein [Lachnospiraceae bacterium]